MISNNDTRDEYQNQCVLLMTVKAGREIMRTLDELVREEQEIAEFEAMLDDSTLDL
jgi:hypothetical protein